MSLASEFLQSQFIARKKKNPRYSQGAFARALGVTSTRVAQYFSGKRLITKSAAIKIAANLNLDKKEKDHFLALCIQAKSERKSPQLKIFREDQLAVTIEWFHLAIVQLMYTKDFKLDAQWIADRMGLTKANVEDSLERLQRVGLISIANGKVELNRGAYTTAPEIPSEAIRKGHVNMLQHVAKTFADVPLEKRDISSLTVAIDSRNIAEAKKLIREFRFKLATLISEGTRDEVYALNIQLCPLTQEILK